jgi:hypothetical protein
MVKRSAIRAKSAAKTNPNVDFARLAPARRQTIGWLVANASASAPAAMLANARNP